MGHHGPVFLSESPSPTTRRRGFPPPAVSRVARERRREDEAKGSTSSLRRSSISPGRATTLCSDGASDGGVGSDRASLHRSGSMVLPRGDSHHSGSGSRTDTRGLMKWGLLFGPDFERWSWISILLRQSVSPPFEPLVTRMHANTLGCASVTHL